MPISLPERHGERYEIVRPERENIGRKARGIGSGIFRSRAAGRRVRG